MNKFSKHKIQTRHVLTILSFICVILIGTSIYNDGFTGTAKKITNTIVTPVQSGINKIGLWISDKKQNMQDLSEAQSEVSSLKSKVDELTQENSLLAQNKYELERLRNLYELDETYSNYSKVAAHVVAKDETGNWFNSFTIDKGSNSGLQKDMNVISGGGLVGVITEVGPNYAKVKSIIDDGYNVSGKSASTSDLCIVQGDLELMDKNLMALSDIQASSAVKEGDMILTSHVSDIYLPGILIGYVTEVNEDSNSLTKSGYLMPVTDFEHLEEVLIITQLKSDYKESDKKSNSSKATTKSKESSSDSKETTVSKTTAAEETTAEDTTVEETTAEDTTAE